MAALTQRQIQILKTVIEEYIETAEPVGSETLDKKYNMGVSPATIRNEMVKLTSLGYLKQVHTSAGRTPTPVAMRYYVDHLMQTEQLSVAEEVAVKEKIWDHRNEVDKLLREATKTLAQRTKTLAVTTTDEGDMYYSGAAHILDMSEFYDIDMTKTILSLLDQVDYWQSIFDRTASNECNVLLGKELGQAFFEPFGGVFIRFRLPQSHQGSIGIVGPSRLNYPHVIPVVSYVGHLLDDMIGKW